MKWLSQWLRRRFGSARALCLVLLGALLFLRVADPHALEEIRLRTFDMFQMIQPRDATQRPVVIVDIDEASLKKFGQWPWPRTRVAELVNRLTQLGVLAVGFDIVFAEPDRLSPQIAAETYRDLDEVTRAKLRALPSNDQVMADAIRRSRVVLGETGLPERDPQAERQETAGVSWRGTDPARFLFAYPGLLRNIPVLDQAAAGRGLFSILTERDGIVRRVPMFMTAQDAIKPALALEMLKVATNQSTVLITANDAGIAQVGIPGFIMPTDKNGRLWVHFAPHDPARYVSAVDVIEGRGTTERFSRRLVLVGTSAAGLLDQKTTPIDSIIPGVEIHAQVLEGILTQSMLTYPNYALGAELTALFAIGIAIIVLAPMLNAALLLLFGAIIIALTAGTSWYLFTQQKLLIDFTYPLLASLLIYLTLVFTNYIREQAQRRQIRSAFSHYMAPALVEQLAQSPDKLKLGGEERDMTIMFSDVRGFTTISEAYKDDPQGLITLMNSFLTPLTNAITDRKGTIDKYMGDAIMAFWNAPLDVATHELNACEAALDMLDCVERLNREREQQARSSGTPYFPIQIGVGINTGTCVVGNMGSDFRFDYSVLGDSVNLASRLEGQCKSYGLPIIIGSRTAQTIKDRFAILELDFIAVKGKKEPEVAYAIMGREDMARSGKFQFWRDLNMRMLTRYRGRDWTGALAVIEEGRAADSENRFRTLYEVYDRRIRAFQITPPPEDWDGAYALESK